MHPTTPPPTHRCDGELSFLIGMSDFGPRPDLVTDEAGVHLLAVLQKAEEEEASEGPAENPRPARSPAAA